MRCGHCHASMMTTGCLHEGGASQTWYQCPTCGRQQTVARPRPPVLLRMGNKHRCSSVWPEREVDGGIRN